MRDGHDVGRDRRRGRGLGATADFGEEGDDLVVATIKLENAGVPTAGGLKVHPESGDVAQVPERDEVLRVDSQRGLKGGAGFLEPTGLEEALTVHDQPVHVAGLFAEGETVVQDVDCVNTSYPGFYKQLEQVIKDSADPGTPVIQGLPASE